MHFEDEGIVLNTKTFGESGLVVTLLTRHHGVHKGLLRSKRQHRSFLELGSHLRITWNARLADQLGTWTVEPLYTPVAYILTQAIALQALTTACHLIEVLLPEREPHTACFNSFLTLTKGFELSHWLGSYCRLECDIIRATGLPLDFNQCAVTNERYDLIYVSPRSGRAVSKEAGDPYKNKLLALPSFLRHVAEMSIPTNQDILAALSLSGYFLERYVLSPHHTKMPPARERLLELLLATPHF
jgi:DNA repair protein RecO (recombination protein O)